MPRIRKKTSNRGTTNDRKKIQRKVRESRKKTKKSAKKNPQWKSKTPKDPGIPNNFPFKDQILAEVSESRRIEAEEKQRRKEEKKALRAKAKNPAIENDVAEGADEEMEGHGIELEDLRGLQVGNDAIGAVGARRLLNAKTISKPAPVPQEEDEEEDEVPLLVNRDLPNLRAVLDEADVIIEVLDARDPLSFRSSHLEELAADKRVLLVLNKIDACPRESISAWATHLRTHYPTALFRSATAFLPSGPGSSTQTVKGKGKAKPATDDALGVDPILQCLGEWSKGKTGDEPLTVAVLGVTNAGKSSLVNSLLRKSALPVYRLESSARGPTTTDSPQEVVLEVHDRKIRVIDTPGLSWEADEATENRHSIRVRDILLRAKGRIDRLKDPASTVANIVSRSTAEDLMLLYNIPAFAKDEPNSFLSGVARSNQLVKKHGELDLLGASRILLRDWSTGKFARYTLPPSNATETTPENTGPLKMLYAADTAILETLVPRKEMRRTKGIVKLAAGTTETRKVALNEPWWNEREAESDADEQDEFIGLDMDVDGSSDIDDEGDEDNDEDEEMDEEEDEELDEETPPPPPPSKKQKRKLADEPPTAPPSKKVAFAPDPKTSKQSRKAGSLKGQTPATKPKPVVSSAKKSKPQVLGRKVANVAKKGKTSASAGAGASEAYDFTKFF